MDSSVLDAIGSPLVQLSSPEGSTLAAKIESHNPGGSAKDRPALYMVEAAEDRGVLSPGDGIVEPTSGNTGIGLAMVGAAKGYDVTLVMPESKSPERRQLMRAYGATLELVDGGISAARERADYLESNEGMIQLGQFENPANPQAHYETSAEEILEQIDGRTVDAVVAGVGTGGTITGIARRLREEFPEMAVHAVEPSDSAVLSGEEPSGDKFQGMGPGFIPENLDTDLIDEVHTVSIDEAEAECRRLAQTEGILAGQSSGASNLIARHVAASLADTQLNCRPAGVSAQPEFASEDSTDAIADGGADYDDCPLVVTVFWDSGERYLSTGMFD